VAFKCTADQGLNLSVRRSGTVIMRRCPMIYVSAGERPIATIDELIADDPTCIASLSHLRGCNGLFVEFIRRHGHADFVRAAYLYLLNRPADAKGLNEYVRYLRETRMPPWQFLLMLSDSDEYRSRARQHCAPTMAAFPFRIA